MPDAARITFVGNEGVLVEAPGSGRSVLIDALFGEGVPAYTTTPRGVVDAVERARPPFDKVAVALATHFHPDHFNPRSTARFLENSPHSIFVSTPQSRRLLEETIEDVASIAGRVHAPSPGEGDTVTLEAGGVAVGAFGLSHGKVNYGDVEHLGLLVDLDGVTILHLGDGIIARRSLEKAGVLARHVDVAFLPFWYLTYPFGQALMREGLKPRRVFAVHIPPAHERRLVEEVRRFDPAAVALVTPMSTHLVEVP
jgi:L-ascorbate metabolism protein UlaG (beta-lactamase superfamily)